MTRTIDRLAVLAPMSLLTSIDVGPDIVARTPHRVYAAGYHRLQRPMGETINVFLGSEADAHRFMRDRSIDAIVFAPRSGEARTYVHGAPDGFAAQLKRGRVPEWLRQVDLGSPVLELYVMRD